MRLVFFSTSSIIIWMNSLLLNRMPLSLSLTMHSAARLLTTLAARTHSRGLVPSTMRVGAYTLSRARMEVVTDHSAFATVDARRRVVNANLLCLARDQSR